LHHALPRRSLAGAAGHAQVLRAARPRAAAHRVRAAGLKDLMAQARFIYGRLPYELHVLELQAAATVERDGYRIAAIPVRHHRGHAFGYAVVEDARPGHLDPELAERLGVTPGPDFGRLQRGETVNGVAPEQVMGQAREGRKLVISGDTAPCEALQIA